MLSKPFITKENSQYFAVYQSFGAKMPAGEFAQSNQFPGARSIQVF